MLYVSGELSGYARQRRVFSVCAQRFGIGRGEQRLHQLRGSAAAVGVVVQLQREACEPGAIHAVGGEAVGQDLIEQRVQRAARGLRECIGHRGCEKRLEQRGVADGDKERIAAAFSIEQRGVGQRQIRMGEAL